MVALRTLACALVLGAALVARADEDPTVEAERTEVDKLRAEIASQIQLQAFDLLDELVFEWTETPIFATPTPVVLADVTVPVGLGTGLEALVENHFASLVIKNPSTKMVLTHCPECSAIVVRSSKEGTVVSRGLDAPEALAKIGGASGSRHAVFLDFEAEGASLVLRARITAVTPGLPIVYAKTLSTSTSSAAMLREGDHLKSAAAARQEYVEALESRGVFLVHTRLALRAYKAAPATGISNVPYLWLESGVEIGLTQARTWTAAFSLGYTWTPEQHDGWMAQARIERLLSGRARSLTEPDLFLFLSGSAITIHGNDAATFANEKPDISEMLLRPNEKPRATFAAWGLGLELRVKNRISITAFTESLPAFDEAPNLGEYLDLGFIEFNSIGMEVGFCL